MARMSMEFAGMHELMAKLERMGVAAESAASAALGEAHRIVTDNVDAAQAASRYNVVPGLTGATDASVRREVDVQWSGPVASVGVGWSIRDGGLASVFLMYGTPTVAPDPGLRNAIFGPSTRKQVQRAYADVLSELVASGSVRR